MIDINNKPYTKETELKLDIFKRCFREWFPVFLNSKKSTDKVFIYDLFAGNGTDSEGRWGSPLWFLSEARGDKHQYCKQISEGNTPRIYFAFNEFINRKSKELQERINHFLTDCKGSKCDLETCVYKIKSNVFFKSDDFKKIAENTDFKRILQNNRYAKFIIIDQYGVKQVTPAIFNELTSSPKTDFIFFIASSALNRFQRHPAMKKYFDTNKINFDIKNPRLCHKVVADYYKSLLLKEQEYYIHHFTIKKGTNYYGLIFGTSHTLGMEKFLKVCWDEDKLAGESNCNEELDFDKGSLFFDVNNTNKLTKVKDSLRSQILKGRIDNNKDGMKYVLSQGCLPKVFIEEIMKLIEIKKVQLLDGYKFNRQSSNIHRVNVYKFKVL